jgi:hypothetical protein
VTDSELKKAFSKGFANPQHLTDLLKRTDLPQDRLIAARTNLAQAYNSGKITKEALQRFISQLSKAKSLNQFDQVHAELRHANRLQESGVVAQNSLVFVSAKKGRQYDLGSTTIKIDPVHEADALYLGTDGLIHLHEVKNTATALRNKLQKKPKQLENMLDWRDQEPDKREIRMVIGTEVGWTQLLAMHPGELAALVILKDHEVSITISKYHLTLASMNELWNATVKKTRTLRQQRAWPGFNEFYRQMPTLPDAERFLGVSLL